MLETLRIESVRGRLTLYYVSVLAAALIIVGAHDTPYILAAADYMAERIPSAQKAVIEDAAHLPNMDQPEEFQTVVTNFLDNYSRS